MPLWVRIIFEPWYLAWVTLKSGCSTEIKWTIWSPPSSQMTLLPVCTGYHSGLHSHEQIAGNSQAAGTWGRKKWERRDEREQGRQKASVGPATPPAPRSGWCCPCQALQPLNPLTLAPTSTMWNCQSVTERTSRLDTGAQGQCRLQRDWEQAGTGSYQADLCNRGRSGWWQGEVICAAWEGEACCPSPPPILWLENQQAEQAQSWHDSSWTHPCLPAI